MEQKRYRRPVTMRRRSILSYEWVRILLFYILPFVVINLLIFFLVTTRPSYDLTVGDTDDYRTADVTFTITSFMPLKNVTVTLDNEPLVMVQTGRRSYRSTVTHNGVLEVHMENFNGVSITGYEVIDILDNELPDVVNYSLDEGRLTLTLSDTQSGIDCDGLMAIDGNGNRVPPLSVDKGSGIDGTDVTAVFGIDESGLTVIVKDMSGNEYRPSFSLTQIEEGALSDSQEPTVE